MISWRKHYKTGLIAICLLLSTSASIYAQGDAKNGEKLFKANCTACHALDKQLVGPALGGIVDKVKKEQNLDTDWLHKWIKDNKALRASGDKYANEIFEKFNKTEMLAFPNLTDKDIDDILEYTTNPPAPEPAATAATGTDTNSVAALEMAQKQSMNSKVILISLFAIGGLLLWLLLKLRQLVKLQQTEELAGLNATRATSFADLYRKYSYIGKGVLVILGIFAAYGIWNWMMWIGVYKGYKPEQPIYFSHKIHAGENKIDCQLCHSSAKYGKVSEVPSMNVCMNCHRNISEYKGKYMEPGKDKAFYDGEIQKVYSATGWDPASQQYTGKTHPVEWTRIHNMPDFVYFNHAQHVVAGEQAIITSFNKKNPEAKIDVVCKACHGQVDTMNVVQMANDFTMGWCIECHRTTEVDMTNGYNKEYFKNLHEKLKKQYGSGTKITVDAIGGLECGKCHY
ncbi:c-type cytochrome [Kaistella jeonii]|uniref:Quinol:cytochrome C oxidoreductase n=1 Tax=Kaistella jeonii TaxID=266749 RepID=A0A0C1FQ63_9FLAO|nr:c-type cytochrome [Kaistella jeonii]KIA90014.1 quinol:cytochrome C oxidoreductase [Kaistella jeonii]SFB79209.1 Cytochrome c2 [Kaistella jeonii]VEI96279.1 cytochrome c6 [Kaistella jeonii]